MEQSDIEFQAQDWLKLMQYGWYFINILDSDDYNLVNKFASEMHFFFIVSECNILQGDSFKISVSKSTAEKCVRCWHRNESVGSNSKHPELCNRCVENLDGPGEDRRFA